MMRSMHHSLENRKNVRYRTQHRSRAMKKKYGQSDCLSTVGFISFSTFTPVSLDVGQCGALPRPLRIAAFELGPALGIGRAPGLASDSRMAAFEPDPDMAVGERCEDAAWEAAAIPSAVKSPDIVDFVCHVGMIFCCLRIVLMISEVDHMRPTVLPPPPSPFQRALSLRPYQVT